MKKIAIGLAVLVILLGAGGLYFYSSLDNIIKGVVEKYGSLATASKVTLDSVKLELTSGNGSLYGLTVTNPVGFSSNKALYLGLVSVTVDVASVRGNGPIVIREIIIDKPQVGYELLNDGTSNLSTIQKNTQTYANSLQANVAGSKDKPSAQEVASGSQPPRKIIIDNLVIRNGQVSISQEMLQGKQLSTDLPEIHLTDIGKDRGGATAGQVAEQILGSITSAASQSALTTLAKEKLNGVLQAVPGASIGKGAIDQVGTQLKGLFGN